MKGLIKKLIARWKAETPIIAGYIKSISGYVIAISGALSASYDAIPTEYQSYVPQNITTGIVLLAFLARIISGFRVKKD